MGAALGRTALTALLGSLVSAPVTRPGTPLGYVEWAAQHELVVRSLARSMEIGVDGAE